jgi:hypothetical protein
MATVASSRYQSSVWRPPKLIQRSDARPDKKRCSNSRQDGFLNHLGMFSAIHLNPIGFAQSQPSHHRSAHGPTIGKEKATDCCCGSGQVGASEQQSGNQWISPQRNP